MSRFIVLAVVATGLIFCFKILKRESNRVAVRVKRAEQERKNGAKGTLVQDPKTGEYRVENNQF